MKRILSRYFPLLPVLVIMAISLFSPSCANTTEAPTGGKKDTIPPVITRVDPAPGTKNVPVSGAKIYFQFDEYVTVKDPKGIFLSPPQKKSPKYKLKGKGVLVYFEEDLLPNTTYTLSLINAVADNNEGNMFPGYTTSFSTGESIDSMFVCGTVRDCNTLKPLKGATVLLYKDHADSAVFLQRPFAATKTDDWGYFKIRNIQDTCYRVYAITDGNNNNIYDPDEDRIAFYDSLFTPTRIVNDTLAELKSYDMKDTLACMARENDMTLNVFREKPSKQMLMNNKRLSDRACYVTFMSPGTKIDSLWFKGFPASKVITEFNILEDSLLLWLNVQRRMPDSLKLCVKYWKTDSLGVLAPTTEEVALVQENKASTSRSSRKKISHNDTICPLKLVAEPETVEQVGMAIEFEYPPILGYFDTLQFKSVNPKQKETIEPFSIKRDSLNLRRYIITPQNKLLQGYDYIFKIPQRTFQDINGFWNDSTQVKVSLPKSEELSTFTLNVTGVKNKYIVDLLDEARKNVLRSFIIEENSRLVFPYLKKARYSVRVTEDKNKNGIVDSGNLLQHRQPEMVIFINFKEKDYIEIPERVEIDQEVNFMELFDPSAKPKEKTVEEGLTPVEQPEPVEPLVDDETETEITETANEE